MASAHEQNTILLDRGGGTSCTINLHGATLTSWKVDGQEQLFVSSKAVFDGKSPIRGGIAIAFPKFGSWEGKPFHGFARVCKWKLFTEIEHLDDGDVEVELSLEDNDYTRSLWGSQFQLVFKVLLGEKQLMTVVNVCNPGKDAPSNFDLSLLTYLRIEDIRQCNVIGLKGEKYKTKLEDSETIEDEEDCVHVDGFMSRFYIDTPESYKIITPERMTRVIKFNFQDIGIWNPWEDVAKTIPDLPDEEYNQFICVKAGCFLGPSELPPGGTWEYEAFQTLQVL